MSCTCRLDDFYFSRYLNKDLNCPMKVPICTISDFNIKQINKKFKTQSLCNFFNSIGMF